MSYHTSNTAHLRSALLPFLAQSTGQALAVTFTLKQSLQRQNGTYQRITLADASNNISHFLKMLNTKCYGKAYKKFRKSLNYVTVFEQGSPTNPKHLHVHMLLYYPDYATTQDQQFTFKQHIKTFWGKTYWSHHEHSIQEVTDKLGWLHYITKEGLDSVDFNNTVLHGAI